MQDFIAQVEKELWFHILVGMKRKRISIGMSQKLARDFLALLPASNKEDLLQKLNKLAKKYEEANAVFVTFAKPHEEEKRQKLLQEMVQYIRSGDIDKALAVVHDTSYLI